MSVFRVGNKSTVNNFPNIRPTLDLDFANSKSLDPRIDFTRASGGSYVDVNGIIKYAGVNEARFDHDPETGESLGLLIEESRTNVWLHSNRWGQPTPETPPSGIPDGKFFTTAGVIYDAGIAPDGTNTAMQLGPQTSAASMRGFTEPANICTFSTFVKRIGSTPSFTITGITSINFNVTFNFNTERVSIGFFPSYVPGSAGVKKYPNGWYRIWFSYNRSLQGNGTLWAFVQGGSSTQIFLWGAQKEAGSFPTSYIPTQASARTRAADNAQITGKNFSSFYNQNEGSVFCKYDRIGLSGADTPWGLNDGTRANSLRLIGGVANNSQRRFDILFSNIPQTQLILSTTETTNTLYKVAVFYKNKDSAGSYDGGSLVRGAPLVIPVVNTLSIGRASLPTPSSIHNGHISRLTYYPKRLPDSNLQALTR